MWNIGFCCRAAKVGKDGLSPIEMVVTVDKVRSFRRLSIKVEPNKPIKGQPTNVLRGLKNKNEESFSTFPASVPYDVLFSNEFLRDLGRLWSLRDIAPDPNNL
ncbi:MAG: hypothetical protein IKA04_02870 [Alistipes sp.]|nr:hypothetical protein [Alistipes sp.]